MEVSQEDLHFKQNKTFMKVQTVFLSIIFAAAVKAFELNEQTAVLLSCPINSKSDLDYLNGLVTAGHHIDIFQEKIAENEATIVQLLTDPPTSGLLRSQAGCFEEKSASALNRLYTNSETSNSVVIGKNFHQDYRSYQNIVNQLKYYARKYPQEVKEMKSIGRSHEGRELLVMHITSQKNSLGTKPLVWIMAGQHAREWIAPASAMLFIEFILKNKQILDDFEFAVMPLVNPDGYEYSRTKNRMWRKNRGVPHSVDLNKNWDHLWCEIGSSRDHSTDIYCGPEAASEPEVRATQEYILSLSNRYIGFDIHSYSQLILRNFGWTQDPSPHEALFAHISNQMAKNMHAVHGVHYKPIPSAGLYPTSGSAEDWLYVKAGIPGFVIELRDKGQHGFHLPKSQIKPTAEELYIGIITAVTAYKQSIKK